MFIHRREEALSAVSGAETFPLGLQRIAGVAVLARHIRGSLKIITL